MTSPFSAAVRASGICPLLNAVTASSLALQLRTRLERILDVTLPANQALLDTNNIDLTRSWEWPVAMGLPVPTQILGELAFASGKFQAIRFPSSKITDAINLVVFTERVVAPSFQECTDPRFPQRIP
jgi:hypothetical protein